jgi:hypothetical protein
MTYTGQQVCDRARPQINDQFKREVEDAELLDYINDLVKVLRHKRPDLFVGSFSAIAADIALGSVVPVVDDTWLPAFVDYLVGMAGRPDDEESAQSVADKAMAKFLNMVGAA